MSTIVRSSLLALALALVATGRPALAAPPPPPAEVPGVVNLNTATETELRRLPGIGPSKARRIIETRTQRRFQSTDQIMRVKGIGRKTYRKLKPNLSVQGPTTLERRPRASPAKTPKTAKGTARTTPKPAPVTAPLPPAPPPCGATTAG